MARRSCASVILILIVGVVAVFGLIQLIPYGHNHSDPAVVSEPAWDSPTTRALAKRACFDCHSNETGWPWYTNIAPVSWLTQRDVDEGRRRLNFSDWKGLNSGSGEERGTRNMGEVISGGSMPPFYYVWLHPTAGLTAAEKQQLIDGLAASLK